MVPQTRTAFECCHAEEVKGLIDEFKPTDSSNQEIPKTPVLRATLRAVVSVAQAALHGGVAPMPTVVASAAKLR